MRGDRTKPYFGVPASTSPPTGYHGRIPATGAAHVPSGRATPRSGPRAVRHGRRDDRGPRGVHARSPAILEVAGHRRGRRLARLSRRRRCRRHGRWDLAGRRYGRRGVPALRRPVHRTALVPRRRGSARTAGPPRVPLRRPGHRSPRRIQRARGADATRRAAEANSLFALSRALATAPSTVDAAPDIAHAAAHRPGARSRAHPRRARPARERPSRTRTRASVLDAKSRDVAGPNPRRCAGSLGADPCADHPGPGPTNVTVHRVRIELDDAHLGDLIVPRAGTGRSGPSETRILALAADQLASHCGVTHCVRCARNWRSLARVSA